MEKSYRKGVASRRVMRGKLGGSHRSVDRGFGAGEGARPTAEICGELQGQNNS
jgi:hypothetical protein